MNIDILIQTISEDQKFTGVFEDNGHVAYAYLLKDGNILSDVWLYNRYPTPIVPEWHSIDNAPFLNPAEFVNQEDLILPVENSEISFEWGLENTHTGKSLSIFLRNHIIGKLEEGSKPGWARFASKSGPLAKVLT